MESTLHPYINAISSDFLVAPWVNGNGIEEFNFELSQWLEGLSERGIFSNLPGGVSVGEVLHVFSIVSFLGLFVSV